MKPSPPSVLPTPMLQPSQNPEQLNLTQVVDFPTNGTNILNLILTDLNQHYLPPLATPSQGTQ
ncbi:hypothetical protein E2C01_061638 [Portunus trituberculatus]|uniref:Uncharacterized protein n=1 Tax=Portunus trituberculatus TaxID=210409 RepID=A0A5B7H4E2_PORTR|nr:hypothetical protein [Portunus trituberculatus]